jgi:hypothetical protein
MRSPVLMRHAGPFDAACGVAQDRLVPASNVPRTLRSLLSRHVGPRHKAGVTEWAGDPCAGSAQELGSYAASSSGFPAAAASRRRSSAFTRAAGASLSPVRSVR